MNRAQIAILLFYVIAKLTSYFSYILLPKSSLSMVAKHPRNVPACMADKNSIGSANTSDSSAESSESSVSINVKTLESQVYGFHVNRNMPIPSLKEKVASATGVPVEQQRLIFRGKVLKDDQMLSGYHVEDGDTFHLVVRPPVQSQTSTGPSSGETNRNTNSGGNDTGSGVPRGRVGVTRSVVVGSFNVGDQGGEGSGSDLSRIIAAVLNSFGIGNQNPTGGVNNVSSSRPSNASNQPSQGVGTSGNNSVRNQSENQMPPGQASTNLPFQSMHQSLPFPLTGAAVVIPSPQMPIPDALHTLSEFINRMESALSSAGFWLSPSPANVGDPEREDLPSHASGPSPSSTHEGDPPRQDLPSNAHGLPTLESLSIILRRAEQLLSGHAVAALSHVAGRLEEEGGATDPTVRNQIQTEAVQVGLAMQHLGSLLLELGRTILTLRMGQSPAQSLVYPGPAVYISPAGPNPIMVQPFPLQTSSLFGGLTSSQTILGMMGGPIGSGNSHRNVNIHIHSMPVGPRGINGEHNNHQGPPNGSQSGPANPVRNDAFSLFGRAPNIYPTRPSPVQNSGPVMSATVQPSLRDSSPESSIDSGSLPALVAQVNAQLSNLIDTYGGNQVQSEDPALPSLHDNVINYQEENVAVYSAAEDQQPKSDQDEDVTGGRDRSNGAPSTSDEASRFSKDVPLGLGMGGLTPKRKTKQVKNASATTSCANDQLIGRHVLQSLVSHGSNPNTRNTNSTQVQAQTYQTQDPSSGQVDAARMMPQVSNNPALNGLLTGMPQQIGTGSPNGLTNMGSALMSGILTGMSGSVSPNGVRNMSQLTQSPAMLNTVNQIAQQIEGLDVLSNLTGTATAPQSGGFDLSRVFQQMMPVFSQALAGSSLGSAPAREPSYTLEPSREEPQRQQVDMFQEIMGRIDRNDPPQEVFRNVLELAFSFISSGDFEDLETELSASVELANEFVEMIHRHVHRQG